MSRQCKEGGFPHDLWLSVSAENVSVYKRGEPKPLETFPYEHIIFFGAPQPCTYKITVDEREMYFETPQVRISIPFYFTFLNERQTNPRVSASFTFYFICTSAGWRDHKDHESLHKHDREEALQREVGIQLRKQLDQVIGRLG